jgi:hypothetical protein
VFIFAVVDISAHYVTFDGMAFHLAVVGDYYLFRTRLYIADYVTVQVRHAPCASQSVCIVAVAIKLSSTHLVIHAPKRNQDKPIIWVNNIIFFPLKCILERSRDSIVMSYILLW